jgi:hypothetical protein
MRVLKKLTKSRFVIGRTLENQKHALHRKCVRDRALIELWLRERMDVSFESDADGVVDGLRDARTGRSLGLC